MQLSLACMHMEKGVTTLKVVTFFLKDHPRRTNGISNVGDV